MNGRPPCSIGLLQGGMLMQSFKVTHGEIPVGEVTLEQEGLYCRIRCLCKPCSGILRLVDRRDSGDFSVGLCGPMPEGYGLSKKIPAKYMDAGTHRFVLTDLRIVEDMFYPISEPMPLSVLKQPEKCRYTIREGVPGIVIGNY